MRAMLELNICSSGDEAGEGEYAGGFIRSVLRTGVLVITFEDVMEVSCCADWSAEGIMNGTIAPSGASLKDDMDRSCVEGFDDMLLWFDSVCMCPAPLGGTPLLLYELGGEFRGTTPIVTPIAGIPAPGGSIPSSGECEEYDWFWMEFMLLLCWWNGGRLGMVPAMLMGRPGLGVLEGKSDNCCVE